MPWLPYKLRDADVWARVGDHGELAADADGRVDMVYKNAPGAKLYRGGARNLVRRPGPAVEIEVGEPAPAKGAAAATAKPSSSPSSSSSPSPSKKGGPPGQVPDGAIAVWTDGACTGNPGPAGIGVVVIEDGERRELSEYLGEATNNIAELTAIERGLELVRDGARPIYVHSDSTYSIGLLSQNWKAKANVELVARIRALTRRFGDLHWVKVPAHAGVPENERCDQLARDAITSRAQRR